MKEWPKDQTEVVDFEQLIEPLAKALKHFYKLTPNKRAKDFPYDGYGLGTAGKATVLPPDESLTTESVRHNREEQGREPLETILNLAFVLGMEQGRRQLLGGLAPFRAGPEFLAEAVNRELEAR